MPYGYHRAVLQHISRNALLHGLNHMASTVQDWIPQKTMQAVGCVPEHDETTEGAKSSNLLILQAGYTFRGILQHEGTTACGLHVVGMP